MSITESQLENINFKEIFQLRRKCAEIGDLESLLIIAKHNVLNGSIATNIDNFPELCYYFGRLQRIEELQEFITENNGILFMLPNSSKQLAQELLTIGYKFPFLDETEISFLEDRYCDSKTFELFDLIMFDSEKLPRPIRKFDKESLNRSNTDFSREFLLEIFECFKKNVEMEYSTDKLYVYSRIENSIIRKKYDDIGLGEYYIGDLIHSDQFCQLMEKNYDEDCANFFAKKLSFDDDWEELKNSHSYIIDSVSIEEIAGEYFSDSSEIENVKMNVALFWLKDVNSEVIDLI